MNISQPALPPLSPELIAQFAAIVGERQALTTETDVAPYVTEERNLFHGRSPLVLRPGSTAEAAGNLAQLSSTHPWFVLMELSSSRDDARATLESILEQGFESGIVDDAV